MTLEEKYTEMMARFKKDAYAAVDEAFDDYPPIHYIEKENDCQEHGLALPF